MRRVVLIAMALIAIVGSGVGTASAGVLFSDNFGDSALTAASWTNTRGNWTVSGGTYYPAAPTNSPPTYTAVRGLTGLTDFSVTVTVNKLYDGGIWLRSSVVGGAVSGVLLVTGGYNSSADGFYWHTANNDTYSDASGFVDHLGVQGHVETLTVRVVGDTYSLYLNGASTPVTQLTTKDFSSGSVGLYGFNRNQSFSNFSVSAVPLPGALLLFGPGLVGLAAIRRRLGK